MGNRASASTLAELKIDDPLLAAAAALLNERSFADVTVEAAAERAGEDVAKALQRYPSSEYLARGIYAEVIATMPQQLVALEHAGADLHDRLCALVITEIEMLAPYKGFVGRSILELVNPLSTQLLLALPLMQRMVAYVADQIAIDRCAGRVSRWVPPSVAAAAFAVLHAQIITYWLVVDDSPNSGKTLTFLDRSLRAFVAALSNPLDLLSFDAPAPRVDYRTQPIAGTASEPGPVKKRRTPKPPLKAGSTMGETPKPPLKAGSTMGETPKPPLKA